MRRKIQEDITSRDRVTLALAQAKESAEAANLAKTEFLSTMSHELRTPLTSITAALGLVQGKVVGEVPVAVGETLDIALRNSDRSATLIDDVLDVSRIEAGNLNFVMEAIEVKALVEQAIEANRPFGASVGVAIVDRDVVPDAWLEADKGRLMQVFANLLSNAVKFSPDGSTVVVSAFRGEGNIQFVVTDNGCGIPKNFRSKVFERFAQADMSDSRQAGGSGLGLSIAKAIVESHPGGSIGFLSEENKGLAFYFALPELIRRSGPTDGRSRSSSEQ
jgi:signal transduction histidine kinase